MIHATRFLFLECCDRPSVRSAIQCSFGYSGFGKIQCALQHVFALSPGISRNRFRRESPCYLKEIAKHKLATRKRTSANRSSPVENAEGFSHPARYSCQRRPSGRRLHTCMTVIVANETPDAIRGLLKRWFIEPKPNVFVGTVNRRTRENTLEYIKRNAPGLGMLIIRQTTATRALG